MAFGTTFKSFGHAMAKAAKYVAVGIKDVVEFANKSQKIEPEVVAVASALAGPQSAMILDLGFHVLGDVAAALEPLSVDVANDVAAKGLNIQMDVQTFNDIKAMLPVLKSVIKSVGGQIPPAPAKK